MNFLNLNLFPLFIRVFLGSNIYFMIFSFLLCISVLLVPETSCLLKLIYLKLRPHNFPSSGLLRGQNEILGNLHSYKSLLHESEIYEFPQFKPFSTLYSRLFRFKHLFMIVSFLVCIPISLVPETTCLLKGRL